MKTNQIAARLRVETLPEYSETQKGYILSLLAAQAAKVFEGLLKENDDLYTVTRMDEKPDGPGETEFAMVVTIEKPKDRAFIQFLIQSNKLISDRILVEMGEHETKGNKSKR